MSSTRDSNPYLDPWDDIERDEHADDVRLGLAVPRTMPLRGTLVGGVRSRLRPRLWWRRSS